ncbi:retinoid-inducible serine carboxypeptidase-like [Tubulanus polymorphus]|uniref:retinoid-inducible serine carboxypeptidase-like n=1 Tax=Tubulanus polymorphus TaxID=672921 RepID=UPI003DA595C9
MATSNRTCFLFVLIMQTGFIRMNKFDTNIDLEAELWNLPQLHGHVKVRENAQMFWWFFNTTSDITSTTRKPLILWIQGGPGRASSGVGNFAEIGAFDQYLKERTENWLQDANVLFIDSPVGVGFSYVTGRSSLADSNEMIVSDLLVLIKTLLTDQLRDFQVSYRLFL